MPSQEEGVLIRRAVCCCVAPAASCVLTWTAAARAGSCGTGVVCNVQSRSQSGADVNFTLEDGNRLRVSVLTADRVRVRFAPSGGIINNISRAVAKATWTVPDFTVTQDSIAVTITTAELNIVVRKAPCVVECRDSANNLIVGDDPARRMQWNGSENAPANVNCAADADFDGDNDVDLTDFTFFGACFNGPNRSPACE